MNEIALSILTIFVILGAASIPISITAESNIIPGWIKNTTSFWATDQISDDEFINAIQYLIRGGIIKIPDTSLIGIYTEKITIGFIPTEKDEDLYWLQEISLEN